MYVFLCMLVFLITQNGLCRRANFTSADMRESDFSGSTFNGAYLEKAVAYKANFTGTIIATEHCISHIETVS